METEGVPDRLEAGAAEASSSVVRSEGFEPSERTLVAGVTYHEKMLEMIDEVRRAASGAD